jgi:hypothetical protein
MMDEHRMVSGGFLSAFTPGDTMQLQDVTVSRDGIVDFDVVTIVSNYFHCGQAVVFKQVHGGRRWSVGRQCNDCQRQQQIDE